MGVALPICELGAFDIGNIPLIRDMTHGCVGYELQGEGMIADDNGNINPDSYFAKVMFDKLSKEVEEALEEARRYGFISAHMPIFGGVNGLRGLRQDLSSFNERQRSIAVRDVKYTMQMAHKLKARRVVIHPSSYGWDEVGDRESRKKISLSSLEDVFRDYVKHEDYRFSINIENLEEPNLLSNHFEFQDFVSEARKRFRKVERDFGKKVRNFQVVNMVWDIPHSVNNEKSVLGDSTEACDKIEENCMKFYKYNTRKIDGFDLDKEHSFVLNRRWERGELESTDVIDYVHCGGIDGWKTHEFIDSQFFSKQLVGYGGNYEPKPEEPKKSKFKIENLFTAIRHDCKDICLEIGSFPRQVVADSYNNVIAFMENIKVEKEIQIDAHRLCWSDSNLARKSHIYDEANMDELLISMGKDDALNWLKSMHEAFTGKWPTDEELIQSVKEAHKHFAEMPRNVIKRGETVVVCCDVDPRTSKPYGWAWQEMSNALIYDKSRIIDKYESYVSYVPGYPYIGDFKKESEEFRKAEELKEKRVK